MEPKPKKLMPSLALLPFVLILANCGGKESSQPPASQIAAKVNSGEISVHQINYQLARTGASASNPEMAPKVRRQILDKLVDQELAFEQAISKKLDRSPEVLMAIENARREILARAYLEQLTSSISKPSLEEAKKYYAEHPQLFAERRVYSIQEIVVSATSGVADDLRQMLDSGKSMEDIANWLKGKEIKFAAGSATRSAEQIPLELLPKIHPLKVGQGLVIQGPQSITLMRVAASQSVPVTEAAALPRIQQFLGNQQAAEAARQELKSLKDKAQITYMGEFAGTEGVASKPVTASVTASNPDKSSQKSETEVMLERGAAGLK